MPPAPASQETSGRPRSDLPPPLTAPTSFGLPRALFAARCPPPSCAHWSWRATVGMAAAVSTRGRCRSAAFTLGYTAWTKTLTRNRAWPECLRRALPRSLGPTLPSAALSIRLTCDYSSSLARFRTEARQARRTSPYPPRLLPPPEPHDRSRCLTPALPTTPCAPFWTISKMRSWHTTDSQAGRWTLQI